jgi:hypothetical protein
MAKGAMFIGWHRPIPGRETVCFHIFKEFFGYLTKLQESGKIDSFEPAILSPHGGDLGGFVFIRGDRTAMMSMRDTEEWRKFEIEGNMNVLGLGILEAMVGIDFAARMSRFEAEAAHV